ncbi:NUDIX domain-containing protein [uncultured Jatrophihabitans sp.]|uniref:NUDIX domain-containing protein n=1 Tax=uncultured Jatrophihabitans sp. TaxID=1610747 RepID=UPI0035CBACDE
MSEQDEYELVDSETVFEGRIITVHRDTVRMSDDSTSIREVVDHQGAVVILALDDEGRVVLVNQYRHPVRVRLDELPAGLLDVEGEPAVDAARRELREETGLEADTWHVLLDLYSSPGFSNEASRVFLARGLRPVDREGFQATGEELTMTVEREPLAKAVHRALSGSITNAASVAGLLAAVHGRATDWRDLRPADAPWPARPQA